MVEPRMPDEKQGHPILEQLDGAHFHIPITIGGYEDTQGCQGRFYKVQVRGYPNVLVAMSNQTRAMSRESEQTEIEGLRPVR
jgi:hypothetical protein